LTSAASAASKTNKHLVIVRGRSNSSLPRPNAATVAMAKGHSSSKHATTTAIGGAAAPAATNSAKATDVSSTGRSTDTTKATDASAAGHTTIDAKAAATATSGANVAGAARGECSRS
jgi:hypothetical protein